MTLFTKLVSGIKWSFISQIGQQGVQVATTIVLARLLSPSDFGLMALATVVIGFVTLFRDLGTSAAVIQRRDLSDQLLSSIFWVNVGFGCLATLLLVLLSPLAASFYHEPRVTPLLRLLAITFLISGLGILQQAILQRDLLFHKLAKIEITATVLGSIVGIGSALLGAGVWSLIYQSLAMAVATTGMLWVFSTWRPQMIFHWAEVKSVSSYSLNLTGFSIINYFVRNADYLLIGRYLGAQNLGYYTIAYRIMLYPLQTISATIGRVMFPFYSQIQTDNARIQQAFLKVAGAIALITFPMMLGLIVLSEPFILALFGPKWSPVIPLLMILAPVGMAQSIGTTTGAIYQAKGRTDLMFRWGMAAGSLIVIAFVIGLQWGILGVATAYASAVAIIFYPNYAIPFGLINLPVRDLMAALWRPLLSSLVMFTVILGLNAVLSKTLSPQWVLGVVIPSGVFVYVAISWFVNPRPMRQIFELCGVKVS